MKQTAQPSLPEERSSRNCKSSCTARAALSPARQADVVARIIGTQKDLRVVKARHSGPLVLPNIARHSVRAGLGSGAEGGAQRTDAPCHRDRGLARRCG